MDNPRGRKPRGCAESGQQYRCAMAIWADAVTCAMALMAAQSVDIALQIAVMKQDDSHWLSWSVLPEG